MRGCNFEILSIAKPKGSLDYYYDNREVKKST